MKVLFINEDIDGDYIAAKFAGWYSNPTIDQLVSDGFTKEEAESLLNGETVEIEGIYGEFNLQEYAEGYHYVSIPHNRITHDNINSLV